MFSDDARRGSLELELAAMPCGYDRQTHMRVICCFWVFGFLVNLPFVLLNFAAQGLSDSGAGLVYLGSSLPDTFVKLTAPFCCSVSNRKGPMMMAMTFMSLGFMLTAFGPCRPIKLAGVCSVSVSIGICEVYLITMAADYQTKPCLAAYASGSGWAGLLGSMITIFASLYLHASLKVQMTVSLWIPLLMSLTFFCLLPLNPTSTFHEHSRNGVGDQMAPVLTFVKRLRYVSTLSKYMVPLFAVYAVEYIIQAGVWSAIGFPVNDSAARHQWYLWSNTLYQIGVVISRSVGGLRAFGVFMLWLPVLLQIAIFVFFIAVAMGRWENWLFLIPAFFCGLFGGFAYPQTLLQASDKEPKHRVHLALSLIPAAISVAIVVASCVSVCVQGCLFGYLNISDLIPDYSCGYNIWFVKAGHA